MPNMDSVEMKMDFKMKPVLSPTRSLDEGFESDPDRISTDSEQTISTPSFDILQTTDRDGLQHTQITRHFPNDYNNSQSGLVCLQGEIESEIIARSDSKVTIPRANSTQSMARHRRIKTKAPLPPSHFSKINRPIDSVRISDASLSAASFGNDITTGNYIRYTVHPKPKSTMPIQSIKLANQAIVPQASSLYTFYPAEGSISLYSTNNGLTYKSSHMNIQTQAPVCWTQTIPRQTRR